MGFKEKWMKKAAAEKRKILQIPGKKARVVYIWGYYKLWIIGIFSAVFLFFYISYHYFFGIKDNWFFITFTNTYAECGNGSELWKDFTEYAGFDLKEKNVYFNNNSYFDCAAGYAAGNEYYELFVAHVEAGTLDCVTMEEDSLIALGSSGRLMDLRDERIAFVMERYADRLVYTIPFDEAYEGEEIPVGIDISDSILMTQAHLYPESCVLGIGSYTQHPEAIETFLEFIFTQE